MVEFEDLDKSKTETGPSVKISRRSLVDRRTGEDKRKLYSLDYFTNGGKERRKGKERRQAGERRSGWMRVYRWCSVFLGKKL